jgi:hypothetical protein
MAIKMRDVARERRWRGVLQRFTRSGLGVRAFCRREKLAESAFYFWRGEIGRRDDELPNPSRPAANARLTATAPAPHAHLAAGCPTHARTGPSPSFLPVHVREVKPQGAAVPETSITLELAGGRLLRLPEMIPAERLAEIIAALEVRTAR